MDSKDVKRVDMIDATTDFCDLNTTSTSGITNFALRLAEVKAKRLLIDGMNQLGGGSTKGVTIDVGVLRGLMTSKAFKCANATLGFANFTNNNTLRTLVKFTKRQLDKLPKENVDDVCQQIHDATSANIAGATPYGIVASDVTDLQAAIDLYRTRNGDTRQAIISRSQANNQAHIMIREVITELLEGQLDVMVNTVAETQAMFWRGYFQARLIIDPGVFSTVLKLLVLNKANNEPILGAKCYKDGSATFKKSSNLGFVTYKDIVEGPSSFVLKHKKFEDLAIPLVMISHGKKHELTVKMKPITNGGGNDIVREGTLAQLVAFNVNTDDVTPNDESTFDMEVTTGIFRVYAGATNTELPGAVFLDVVPGTPYHALLSDFADLIGLGDAKPFLMIQYLGPVSGHYKITFGNV